MYPFDYRQADSIDAAAELLGRHADAKLLAGGMSLLPAMKLRLAHPAMLVDLNGIEGLRGIEVDGGRVRVRAMTVHEDVATAEAVRRAIPALADLAGGIGDPQVRHRGTIGGSIANADPGACYPAAVLGLGATVRTNRRSIPADEFFIGLFETAIEPEEMITAVEFPVPEKAAYVKFANLASRFSIASVFVSRRGSGVRVAVTGAAHKVFRCPEFEGALAEDFRPEAVAGLRIAPGPLLSDLHGSAEYRAALIPTLIARAVTKCG